MDQNLKFIITADGSGLRSESKQATNALTSIQNKIKQLQSDIASNIKIMQGYENEIANLTRQYKAGSISQREFQQSLERLQRDEKETTIETKRLRQELTRLNRDQKTLSSSMDGVTKSTRGASSAAVAFTGIIQDAPYGIRGVANNIEFFVQQMTYLRRNTGGTTAAIKTFLSSLAGPTGVLLAISAVTSAMVYMSNSGTSLTGVLEKLGLTTRNLTTAQRAYVESLNEAISASRQEISTLNSLLAIARDDAQVRNVRQKAIDEINKQYGTLLGNLDLEILKTDRVTQSVNNLTRSLIKQAQVKALQEAIDEKATEAGETLVDLALSQREAYNNVASEVENLRKNIATFNQFVDKDAPLEEQLERIQELTRGANNQSTALLRSYINSYNAASKRVKEFTKETEDSIKPLEGLLEQTLGSQFLNDIMSDAFDMDEIILKPGDVTIERPKNIKPIEIPVTITDLSDLDIDAIAKRAKSGGLKLVEAFRLIESGSVEMSKNVTASIEGLNKVATPETIAFGQRMIELQNTAKIVTDTISAGFNAMTRQIVDSLNTGSAVLDAIISAFIGSISSLVSALISQQITESILGKAKIETERGKSSANAVTIATNAAAALGPLGAVALPGLIASQLALIQGAFAGIQVGAFAQGGIVPGGSFTGDRVPAYVNSGEMILNNRQQQNLFGMLNGGVNASRVNSGEGSYVASTRVRGGDLLVVLERAQKKNRRFGSGINTNQ